MPIGAVARLIDSLVINHKNNFEEMVQSNLNNETKLTQSMFLINLIHLYFITCTL